MAPPLPRPARLPRTNRTIRLRRLRGSPALRELFAESRVEPVRLIYPVFVRPGAGAPQPIPSMPGISRIGADRIVALGRQLVDEGLRAVLLFGLARHKDPEGREAWSEEAAVPRAVRALRRDVPELAIFTDVCLCAYTSHGHCGIVRGERIANDPTLERLARVALAHARAGADFVAPSAMMDHQVAAIRSALDLEGFTDTGILAYAAKLASAFYEPFREAEGSAPAFGDRRTYQIDPRNGRQALAELEEDAAEGADVLMVKPGLPALDILARARRRFDQPLASYQVSGEYSMIRAAAERGWLDERAAALESLGAIRRAGADLIVTYFARDVARWRREER